jgi:phosphate starvation-inducible PhoH-like protein
LNAPLHIHRFSIEPVDPRRLASLCGQFDEHLLLIEQRLARSAQPRQSVRLIGVQNLLALPKRAAATLPKP